MKKLIHIQKKWVLECTIVMVNLLSFMVVLLDVKVNVV